MGWDMTDLGGGCDIDVESIRILIYNIGVSLAIKATNLVFSTIWKLQELTTCKMY